MTNFWPGTTSTLVFQFSPRDRIAQYRNGWTSKNAASGTGQSLLRGEQPSILCGCSPRRRLWPAQKTLDERGEQPQRMDGDYHRIVTTPTLDRTSSPKPDLISARVSELQQTLNPDDSHAYNQVHDVQRALRPTTM